MYAAKRRKMLQFLLSRARPRCSLSDIIDRLVSPGYSDHGRGMDECEIHIDGNMFFWVAGAVGAGLAWITYQAQHSLNITLQCLFTCFAWEGFLSQPPC